MEVLELIGIAMAPGFAIVLYIYFKDKHEREPLLLLLLSFIYGILSTLVTLSISVPVNWIIELRADDLLHQFYEAFFKVALIEEFSKFIFVRFVLFPNRNFNEPFDGIVYAVMVSMGFATLENIVYVSNGGLATGVMRMFTAVPAHATFGVLMGYFLGKGKFTDSGGFVYSVIALATATLFHGAYDYFLFIVHNTGVWTGIWLGALVALIFGIILSRNAIRIHQQASPFIEARAKERIPD